MPCQKLSINCSVPVDKNISKMRTNVLKMYTCTWEGCSSFCPCNDNEYSEMPKSDEIYLENDGNLHFLRFLFSMNVNREVKRSRRMEDRRIQDKYVCMTVLNEQFSSLEKMRKKGLGF